MDNSKLNANLRKFAVMLDAEGEGLKFLCMIYYEEG